MFEKAKTSIKHLLLKPAYFVNTNLLYMDRMGLACARGALNAATRKVDPHKTQTWEFTAFSQNGEDGIIDQLTSFIKAPNRYFIEIGASDGLENNSAYLAFVRKYNGIMVEGNSLKARSAKGYLQSLNWGVKYLNWFITQDTVEALKAECLHLDPDFISIDIDGNDYYIARALVGTGLRPKIVCVEYNSAYGPTRSITIKYDSAFDYTKAHPSRLYYGVSIAGWRRFFEQQGYEFVTVDRNGVNAFFVDPEAVDTEFLDGLERLEFHENFAQIARYGDTWKGQFRQIQDMVYCEIE